MRLTAAHMPTAGLFRRLIPVLTLVFALAWGGSVFAAQFSASVDRNQFTVGETVSLTLTFSGGEPKELPEISVPGLQFAQTGQNMQTSWVNGRVSMNLVLTYTITAQRAGTFTIPALTINVGNEKLTSQPIELVASMPGSTVLGANGETLAMAKLVLPRDEAFLGEAFTCQLQLFLSTAIREYANFSVNFSGDGYVSGKIKEEGQQTVKIDNADFRVFPLTLVITPVRADKLNIGPVVTRLTVVAPNQRLRRYERRDIVMAAETQVLNVSPVPKENIPPGYSGAIGNFSLTVSAAPTNLTTGDPITLKVRITGKGNLEFISLPEQSDWENFKPYPATSALESMDALGIEGSKVFEQVIIPQNAEIRFLPAFNFTFFDPEKKTFRTLKSDAVPITVRPSASAAVPTVAGAASGSDTPASDIVPIKQRLGAAQATVRPWIQQPAFLAMQAVPLLAFLSAAIWRKRQETLANNPRLRRYRQVAHVVKQGIDELKGHAARNDSDSFFATVFRLLQEQLGERLDVPASSITEAVIEERLRPKGVSEQTLAELHDIFQACNLARYAPVKSSQELAAMVKKVESTLHKLQEVE